MNWIAGIENAVRYIEGHITENLDYTLIARESFSSPSHFQRVFSILCGYTLGEYIRYRRLTLAGAELSSGKSKVIDVAFKYGYDSPDSFAKAFQKFHGIAPSQAKGNGAMLKSFSCLHIKISLEGGTIMDYRLEKKPAMTLLGYKRHFEGAPYGKSRFEQEENLFLSTRAHQWMLKGMSKEILSEYCVLTNMDDNGYDFYIAVSVSQHTLKDLYNPDVTGIDFMERFGFELLNLPACTYAVFETEKTKYPVASYAEMRKRIVSEWLPSTEYHLVDAPEIAVYHWGIVRGYTERTIEVWMPIEDKE